ncbi:hypothetical protein K470DRAFT_258682 [Piedraia hortae CBS 480.64]|uniref:Uncharacterized protein n=1 Tax=Piedraia hortae CBS 480.64 TaxID=1314780 RepID=A0A6A7BY94_9PEZI|nr:hypothetical protein K470DRAFT_258682 [Piedraia hortae CBS 480.64]
MNTGGEPNPGKNLVRQAEQRATNPRTGSANSYITRHPLHTKNTKPPKAAQTKMPRSYSTSSSTAYPGSSTTSSDSYMGSDSSFSDSSAGSLTYGSTTSSAPTTPNPVEARAADSVMPQVPRTAYGSLSFSTSSSSLSAGYESSSH